MPGIRSETEVRGVRSPLSSVAERSLSKRKVGGSNPPGGSHFSFFWTTITQPISFLR